MKLRYSFVLLFGVTIFCIIACSNVVASDMDEYRECAGQYLKAKGLLDHEPPTPEDAAYCELSMGIVISFFRDNYDLRLRNKLPYDYVSIVANLEKSGIFDLVIKRRYIEGYERIPVDEQKTILDNIKQTINEKLNSVVSRGGGKRKKVKELINAGFFWAEERNGSPSLQTVYRRT